MPFVRQFAQTNSNLECLCKAGFIFLLFMIVAVLCPFAAILIARILGPRKPNPIKQSTYECGMETVGESWVQFKAQYYVFALIFLVFDVETVFLFPWAISLNALPMFAVVEGVIFHSHPCCRIVLHMAQGHAGVELN